MDEQAAALADSTDTDLVVSDPPAGIISDPEEPKEGCCFFYGAFQYFIEETFTDLRDFEYFKLEVCMREPWRETEEVVEHGGYMTTAASFLSDNTAHYQMMNDNMQSYKCGQKTGVEFCNGTYTERSVYDEDSKIVGTEYYCQGTG